MRCYSRTRSGVFGLLILWLFLAVSSVCGDEAQSCKDADKKDSLEDNQQEQLQETLRRLVQGYARSEKASYSSILSDVNLLMKDKLPADVIDNVVKEAIEDKTIYVDRLIHNMLETVADPDCMSREFDLSQNFNATEAASVMHKCKLLVLRNVFDMEILKRFKADFTAYVRGLDSGRIKKTGRTTNGEDYFHDKLDHGRWELLVPEELAEAEIIRNDHVLNVITSEKLLGPDLVLHSMGAALADSGAKPQDWHTDSDFIFADKLYEMTGLSHHELPAYAITMMVPLLNMTPEHGPTQFCMGSSNLAGMEENLKDVKLRDESLRAHLQDQPDLAAEFDDPTPCKYMRTPLISFGDVLLFDYQIIHRGGHNVSPDLRSMLYLTYSRFWYKDKGFEDEPDEDEDDYEDEEEDDEMYKQLTKSARFAIPDDLNDEDIDGSLLSGEDANLESLGIFHGLPRNTVDY